LPNCGFEFFVHSTPLYQVAADDNLDCSAWLVCHLRVM
jgi:hypothetical protein